MTLVALYSECHDNAFRGFSVVN